MVRRSRLARLHSRRRIWADRVGQADCSQSTLRNMREGWGTRGVVGGTGAGRERDILGSLLIGNYGESWVSTACDGGGVCDGVRTTGGAGAAGGDGDDY